MTSDVDEQPSSRPTPRERARERTLVEIRAIAWHHVEANGAAALSLRAIARELGIVSSAIYRYVPSRDDLLTDLIVEGFTDLADHTVAAAEAARGSTTRERWLAIGHAMRTWALLRPVAWGLLYGSPVPGYQAPAERTTDAGTRVMGLLAHVVADAVDDGSLDPIRAARQVPGSLVPGLEQAATAVGTGGGAEAVAATILGWTSLVGGISTQVFGQFGADAFGDPEAWGRLAVDASADVVGLTVGIG